MNRGEVLTCRQGIEQDRTNVHLCDIPEFQRVFVDVRIIAEEVFLSLYNMPGYLMCDKVVEGIQLGGVVDRRWNLRLLKKAMLTWV